METETRMITEPDLITLPTHKIYPDLDIGELEEEIYYDDEIIEYEPEVYFLAENRELPWITRWIAGWIAREIPEIPVISGKITWKIIWN